ncbi:hypothetical protein GCM10022395_34130 [Snuella lapsa]|uniref:HMA domain-containing protein n=1 Tax=Snuella lapsa TaxID=870481 RepID=A0ABP6YHH0_9FLAO
MIVSVFRTSICPSDIAFLSTIFDKIHAIHKWNTDLEDCDNILRIVSYKDIADSIINILAEQGYHIQELEE